MKRRIGVYAGSFNPFHIGHKDILDQARPLFDQIIIAIGDNPEKSNLNREPFPISIGDSKVAVSYYHGLLSDKLSSLDLNDDNVEVFLIRGLRNGEDLQYEQNQIQFIRDMYPSLRVVFFICNRNVEHVSSSALRALRKISPIDYKKYTFE